ncbi:glycerate kinase type-2 family protein [Granulosicoccus sp. 3-233]|uniref:glycerate kinase type-2 family protein n=1 Tax=Granulosicoccus sp. 3-233 TaxID=3417969 RepID=UPI003D329EF4
MSQDSTTRAGQLHTLFKAGVDAVGGRQATQRTLQQFSLSGQVHLVALGKAADAMAAGALAVLGDKLVSGLVITKHDHLSQAIREDERLECHEAGHPVPDEASLIAGERLSDYVAAIPSEHMLVFLVSGGTSALVEHLNDGLDLTDLKRETDQLLASGAAIGEMNRHRRTLSQIKGGKLARRVRCPVLQLLISDVPGDKPGDIGSGLLVPDEATGMGPELAIWDTIDTHIIASSGIAQEAVADAAEYLSLPVRQARGSLDGDMPEVVSRLAGVLSDETLQPGVYIWGGEPTLVLPASPGRGGRNQHLALSLAEHLVDGPPCSVLVCGTDGTDGPTADAGGLVNEQTLAKARDGGLNIDDYLARADAGSCLERLDALVTTGPTGTNVMDLAIAVVGERSAD